MGSRGALECPYGFCKIRSVSHCDRQNVTVIRHEAVGIYGKSLAAKLSQFVDQQFDQSLVIEKFAALACANRKKVAARAQIIGTRKTMPRMFFRHVKGL